MKKLFMAVMALGVLLLGCTAPGAGGEGANTSGGPSITVPNISVTVDNETIPVTNPPGGNETANQTPPAEEEPEEQYAAYDLRITDVSLNTTKPTLSQFSNLGVTVEYEGAQAPSRYKVSYYDGSTLVETKTVNSPDKAEAVNFNWLGLQDGVHNLRAVVELFADEPVKEDGPAENNQMSAQFEIFPIEVTGSDAGQEVSARMYRAQQFVVQNKIGIGTIWVYLKADSTPEDVQLAVELRKDDFNKPGTVLKTNRIAANSIGAPQWYTFSYGTNGVFLTPGKYWIVMYLDEESANKPTWLGSGDVYTGLSAELDKTEGYGNIWHTGQDDFAFKVSSVPQ